ncbi:cell division protein SepF [Priestia taiwanensis]|uniref:Cell division protein SepF n=1 Tax=Priestia taiwanensis TaxID=1347902 RepID=A0A917AUV1_9BACI|nr:cell division protein SepF [Priestia taiwanensis]MBM7363442.1 hypothetical protein [Priestia taiwanensis]GGE77101.1 hypothetical protein GCM10007140_28490 [Priestia taiwanensis]
MSIISKLFDLPEKATNRRNGEQEQESQLVLFELKVYEDASTVANYLLQNKSVIMSMKTDNIDVVQQAVSFLDGVLHVIGGDMKEVGEGIFLCVPNNVSVSGSISEALLQRDEVEDEEMVEEAPIEEVPTYEEVFQEEAFKEIESEEVSSYKETYTEESKLYRDEDIEEEKRRLGLTRR